MYKITTNFVESIDIGECDVFIADELDNARLQLLILIDAESSASLQLKSNTPSEKDEKIFNYYIVKSIF